MSTPEDSTAQWLKQNEKVCLCKGIPRKVIDRAIAGGAKTINDVNRKTGSGYGGCKGMRCGPAIKNILEG